MDNRGLTGATRGGAFGISRGLGGMARLGAFFCLLVLIGVGAIALSACAESKLDKAVATANADAAVKDKQAADAAAKLAADQTAAAAAVVEATDPESGVVDPAKLYAGLVRRLADPEEKAKLAADVGRGTAPDVAAANLVKAALADAAKFAADAKAARDAAAALAAQKPAAIAADSAAWSVGIGAGKSIADLIVPGAGGLLVGAVGLLVSQIVRGRTFSAGQTDGAEQVTQGVATLRKLVPAVDAALNSVPPLVKAAVVAAMDDHVAEAVAANRDKPPAETASLIHDVSVVVPAKLVA